jgi:hypothetical protein
MTTIREAIAFTVPRVDPLEITKLAGVPETVVTVPLPRVVERKFNVNAEAEIVNALAATEAEIGCICAGVGVADHALSPRKKVEELGVPVADICVNPTVP